MLLVRFFCFEHRIVFFLWVMFPIVLFSIHFLRSCFCGHLCGVCDGFAISLFCMHIQTHTTYITVAFGMRNSVSACTIWPSHNSAHLHVAWLLGGIFALFQPLLDKEAFNCVFNEPEQENSYQELHWERGTAQPPVLQCRKAKWGGGTKGLLIK